MPRNIEKEMRSRPKMDKSYQPKPDKRYKTDLSPLEQSLSARLTMLAGGSLAKKYQVSVWAVRFMLVVSVICILVAVVQTKRADRLAQLNCAGEMLR
jgi:hypothetical protein